MNKMRYFAELAYNGFNYSGWQKQPHKPSMQETIEKAFSTILGAEIEIIGCGRTDAGVHASQYFMHFDFDGNFPKSFLSRVNKFLPKDIVIFRIFEVAPEAHARFDAVSRSYIYQLSFIKNPFEIQTTYFYPYALQPDFGKMQEVAQLLLNYQEFYPFCKSHHDAKTLQCELTRSEWLQIDENRLEYHITSNRFLRGMVRLIVGMCLNVGIGKITLEEVKSALDQQTLLNKSWSAPPEGLFLRAIKYPFIK
ncbi:MAG: tRNA pseudouridine(38-40) synthase TruA [Saprospiraceae bacterium]|nr:tRNA pseudouridine(38-40) synthase TruA [Saprospiraceae bacterium]